MLANAIGYKFFLSMLRIMSPTASAHPSPQVGRVRSVGTAQRRSFAETVGEDMQQSQSPTAGSTHN